LIGRQGNVVSVLGLDLDDGAAGPHQVERLSQRRPRAGGLEDKGLNSLGK
jgi:hypothetical protein